MDPLWLLTSTRSTSLPLGSILILSYITSTQRFTVSLLLSTSWTMLCYTSATQGEQNLIIIMIIEHKHTRTMSNVCVLLLLLHKL